jgi:hypothetical protein
MNKIDLKILELIEILKANSTIRFENEFCDNIELLRQNLYRIRKGLAHFTPEHIQNICKVYKVDANWIFGITPYVFIGDKNVKLAL